MVKADDSVGVSSVATQAELAMPEPESSDLGRYLEDTITIDWQTPSVMGKAKELLDGATSAAERVDRLFRFVRDEIAHSQDIETDAQTCRASEVLEYSTGICYAKSHLLAALLRIAGFPTGFCYVRLVNEERPDRFILHGFNAVYWNREGNREGNGGGGREPAEQGGVAKRWIYLDARGNKPGVETECRFEAPFSFAYPPDPEKGEAFLPFIYRRPGKRIIDLLERAPSLDAVTRHLPGSL